METPLDSINICLLGGYSVGKTCLLNRFIGSKSFDYNCKPSDGATVAKMVMNMKNGLQLQIRLIDISAEVINSSFDNENSLQSSASYPLQCMFQSGFGKIDGSFIVMDCSRHSSFDEVERCLHVIETIPSYEVNRMMLVNKFDLTRSERAFTTQRLDTFSHHSKFSFWGYVVAHSAFGDFDVSRGDGHRQQSPEDILKRMIMSILKRRDENIHKLIDVPSILQFQKIQHFDSDDLLSMWSS
jgi:GTPase SAR1 family protein